MIGCFGKLPADADFVSLHGALEEVREFDAWLQAGLGRLQREQDWRLRLDQLPLCFFCYRARNGHWLFGGLASSRDASGRRYPFIIFQRVIGLGEGFVGAYTLCEPFARQLTPLLNQARSGAGSSVLLDQVAALRPWSEQDFRLYQQVHRKFLADFNFHEVAQALEQAYPEFGASAALHRLAGFALQLRRGQRSAINLPLPAARWLQRPVADLWRGWLASLARDPQEPEVSLLRDDFMRPTLLCLSRGEDTGYVALTGCASRRESYELLEPFETFDEHRRGLPLPDVELCLRDFIERFTLSLHAALP